MSHPPTTETNRRPHGPPSVSLDAPEWAALRALAHRIVDDVLDDLEAIGERPVWRQVPPDVAERFTAPVPREPLGVEAAYWAFLDDVAPYRMCNDHPRLWGWYMGNGTVMGALAAILVAAMNTNNGGGNHAGNLVEAQVVRWFATLLGLPAASSGLLTSGASMANLVGLAVARNERAGVDVRTEGLAGSGRDLVVYASSETHSCNQRALELMGIGRRGYRTLLVDERYRLDLGPAQVAARPDRGWAGPRAARGGAPWRVHADT